MDAVTDKKNCRDALVSSHAPRPESATLTECLSPNLAASISMAMGTISTPESLVAINPPTARPHQSTVPTETRWSSVQKDQTASAKKSAAAISVVASPLLEMTTGQKQKNAREIKPAPLPCSRRDQKKTTVASATPSNVFIARVARSMADMPLLLRKRESQ